LLHAAIINIVRDANVIRTDMGMRKNLLIIGAILASGCSGGDKATGPDDGGNNTGAETVDVYTPGLVFSPSFITIGVGGTVRFNITGVAHDVTFQSVTGAPASIPVTTSQVVSRTFNAKGTFPFDCRTHPGMSGSVTVQ
jgi:plastocyanin